VYLAAHSDRRLCPQTPTAVSSSWLGCLLALTTLLLAAAPLHTATGGEPGSEPCVGLSGLDYDADGYCNDRDVCPLTPDPDQADSEFPFLIAPFDEFIELAPEVGFTAFGPIVGTNLEFSCAPCAEATFQDAVTTIGDVKGGGGDFCGFSAGIPRQIIQSESVICARSTLFMEGEEPLYELRLRSHYSSGNSDCFDAENGAACAAAGGETSFGGGDFVGDACDNCPEVLNADQADFDDDGTGDACEDSDEDLVLDAVDVCPADFNPEQADVLDSDLPFIIATTGEFQQLAPGVGLTADRYIEGTNLEFSCGTCAEATFEDAVTVIGNQYSLCGYSSQIPRNIIQNGDTLCARETLPMEGENYFQLQLRSHRGGGGEGGGPLCFDADGGAQCAAVGNQTSFGGGDWVGDLCDNCPTVRNSDQADFNANGTGDVCEDSDKDQILDAADVCPADYDPGQADSESGYPLLIAARGEFVELAPQVGFTATGPIEGINLEFACAPCAEATFGEGVTTIGSINGSGSIFCGYFSNIPRQIIENGDVVCAQSTLPQEGGPLRYELLLRSHRSNYDCFDNDGGDQCAGVGGETSFGGGDFAGDLCDNCPAVFNTDQADFNDNGVGDACEDSDKDQVYDAWDVCPADYDPGQEDSDLPLVIAPFGQFIELEPGVGFTATGPIEGTNLEFSCGVCQQATFEDPVTTIGAVKGGNGGLCGYSRRIPRQIIENGDVICARSTPVLEGGASYYELRLRSHSGSGKGASDCFDANDGAQCAVADDETSFGGGDFVGNLCDNCPDHLNADQSDLDEDGVGDVCDPEPIPEPAAGLLGAGALVSLGLLARRRGSLRGGRRSSNF